MRLLLVVFAALALVACGGNAHRAETASFDLGVASPVWKPASPPLRAVGVFAPSWLATTAIQYRLLYADAMRRAAYAQSRWAAPPGELIERALDRQTFAPGGCLLRLDIDELAQVFDSPQASRTLLDVRASLVAPDGGTVLARKAFSVAPSAPTPDARGGVIAAGAAVQELGGKLGAWLADLARASPLVTERCRAG